MIRYYVITDPCYLLTEAEWDECCRYLRDNGTEDFHNQIRYKLTSKTGSQSYSCDTGFGDWGNEISGNIDPIHSCFGADSGSVCVCEYVGEIKTIVSEKNLFAKQLAGLVAVEDEPEVIMDTTDPNWTVVRITDGVHRYETMD